VQDRDSLPVSVLQRMMGWPKVVRIWLPEWLIERSRVIDDTVASYEEAKAELAQSAVLRAAQAGRLNASAPPVASEASLPERPVHVLLREAAESRLSRHQIAAYEATLVVGEAVAKKEEFRMASAAMPVVRDSQDLDFCPYEDETLIGTKEDIADGAPGTAHFRIRSAIDAVLNIEAPIEAERLAKLVARRFGLQRVREDRVRLEARNRCGGLEGFSPYTARALAGANFRSRGSRGSAQCVGVLRDQGHGVE
jgi:histone H3/H4